eukprot:GILK01005202.1.p1 GENE.GILK01005202.1~~GILK01005202.1.p1  ORF type:complete len:245 (-),score=46.12 GILK01005202.1:68-802(-)
MLRGLGSVFRRSVVVMATTQATRTLRFQPIIYQALNQPAIFGVRTFAAKNAKKKDTSDLPPVEIDFKAFEQRMDEAVEAMKRDYAKIRAGRASVQLFDSLVVNVGGERVPLSTLGQVVLKTPQLLAVNLFDQNSADAVVTAINGMGMSLNAQKDSSTVIKVPIAKATKESRDQLTKAVSKLAEDAKGRVRNVRRDGMQLTKGLEKSAGKDEAKRAEKKLQTITDNRIDAIEKLRGAKEKDILEA